MEPVGPGAWVEPAVQGAWVEPAGQGAWVEPAGQGAWVEPAGQGAWVEPARQGVWVEPDLLAPGLERALCRALHGPGPRRSGLSPALARQLIRVTSSNPTRARNSLYYIVSAIRILQFCMKLQSDCISFHYFIKVI